MSVDTPVTVISQFHELHKSGCFVIPNPWDRGSAIYLAHLGFKALATTSAGFAYSRGLPDDVKVITRPVMLEHVGEIVAATPLPVNADFQNGYADEPEDVAESVTLCVATGVAGLSIEDSTGNSAAPLYEEQMAVERIKAARAAIDATKIPVLLTARCEAWLTGHSDAKRIALDRLVKFADAGADCLYAPGVSTADDVKAIVAAVSPKPVNVLASRPGFTVTQLADLGVRRISVGSALARVAWGAFVRAAEKILSEGSFDSFGEFPTTDLNSLFRTPQNPEHSDG